MAKTVQTKQKYRDGYIDMTHQNMYNVGDFRQELIKLRLFIREMGLNADNIDVAEYEQKLVVLHWLIEDVELRDERHGEKC